MNVNIIFVVSYNLWEINCSIIQSWHQNLDPYSNVTLGLISSNLNKTDKDYVPNISCNRNQNFFLTFLKCHFIFNESNFKTPNTWKKCDQFLSANTTWIFSGILKLTRDVMDASGVKDNSGKIEVREDRLPTGVRSPNCNHHHHHIRLTSVTPKHNGISGIRASTGRTPVIFLQAQRSCAISSFYTHSLHVPLDTTSPTFSSEHLCPPLQSHSFLCISSPNYSPPFAQHAQTILTFLSVSCSQHIQCPNGSRVGLYPINWIKSNKAAGPFSVVQDHSVLCRTIQCLCRTIQCCEGPFSVVQDHSVLWRTIHMLNIVGEIEKSGWQM